jgi:hypothetical protein
MNETSTLIQFSCQKLHWQEEKHSTEILITVISDIVGVPTFLFYMDSIRKLWHIHHVGG